jgi:hypothetical protein
MLALLCAFYGLPVWKHRTLAAAGGVIALLGVVSAVTACGGAGASSPQDAVSAFLEPWSDPPKAPHGGGTAPKEIQDFWAQFCDLVDPEIRAGLRFEDDDRVDKRVNCGAVVVTYTAYTGDTGEMAPPSRISGKPVSARIKGDTSVVSVAMHYAPPKRSVTAPDPPATARIKVLVVRRDGGWFVATPQAFNPRHARVDQFDENALREQHRALLAAARK